MSKHTTGPQVRFHPSFHPYGIQPVGTRWSRLPTVAEVMHFQTCWADGPYSAVNCQVPLGVPVWQYIDPQERAAASRKCSAISKSTGCSA